MPKRPDMDDIKTYLADLIDYEGITNQQLMHITGMPASQVSKWKNKGAFPKMEDLLKICQKLGISLDTLYDMDKTIMIDTLKIEKYGIFDEWKNNKFSDPCYYYSEDLLNDSQCEKVLKAYVTLLKTFNDEYIKYLNNKVEEPPVEIAERLYFYYVDEENADDFGIHLLQGPDLSYFKEFVLDKEYIDSDHNPHFYPINADYVMLMSLDNNKQLVFNYLVEINRLDKIFSYNKALSHRRVNEFFELYEELLIDDKIRDSHGELFKKIIECGGLLGNEKKYARLIAKLVK